MLPQPRRRLVDARDIGPHRLAARPARQHKVGIVGLRALQVIHHEATAVCLHFLQKPFAPAALARKVRELLDAT
jgi:hypothetical protein